MLCPRLCQKLYALSSANAFNIEHRSLSTALVIHLPDDYIASCILIRAMDKAAARRRRNLFYLLYLGYAAIVTLAVLAALGLL